MAWVIIDLLFDLPGILVYLLKKRVRQLFSASDSRKSHI
jgi:hypothetical protein